MPSVSEPPCHVFLVTFPGQGHMNPTLRLGKKLAFNGFYITISTTLEFGLHLKTAGSITDGPSPVGTGFIDFQFWDDGLESNDPRRRDLDHYIPQLEISGKPALTQMIKNQAELNRPVSCLIGNPFVPWVCDVAFDLGIPCSILWVQSCSVFSIYYHYSQNSIDFPSESDPYREIKLPSLPVLKHDEIPSFMHPYGDYKPIKRLVLQQFQNISIPFCILMDTFEDLEKEVITHVSKTFPVKPIGPLFKTLKFSDEIEIAGDFLKPDDCFDWLDSKAENSVVYISFGSVVNLSQNQVEEMAYGLCNSGFCFLWVMKPAPEFTPEIPDWFMEKTGEKGKIVKWSLQERVLSHSAIGCFVTHCGWNSSVEALSSGVPVVVLPEFGDQVTNAKFLVDKFRVGIRMGRGGSEKRVVMRDEVEKCLRDAVDGPMAEELRANALKWKIAAELAAADGGSSEMNIQEFVDEIKKKSVNVKSVI